MKNKTFTQAQRFFTTGVSLITSYGPHGKNVMAAEWTMQISYDPMLIAVFIHDAAYTLKNIRQTKRFGVNVASEDQATLVSVAGGYSKNEVDKLKIHGLFYLMKSKSASLPLIANCVINAECELFTIKKIGDHKMVVGKVTQMRYDETKKPLLYHRNKYFRLGHNIEPARDRITVNKKLFDVFSQREQNRFILKAVGVLVKSKNKLLVMNHQQKSTVHTIPFTLPKKDKNNKKELEAHLRNVKLKILLRGDPMIKRLIVKNRDKNQRINFVLFKGVLQEKSKEHQWTIIESDSLLKSLIK